MLTKKYSDSQTFNNEYDEKGRISSSSYGGTTVNYAYDTHGQLVSANDDTYDYDDRGNITSKTVGDTTTTFTYNTEGWKDLLVKVNDDKLTYDANGNVLTYGDREYTWNTGRNLESIVDGDNEYRYTYDENGIRTSKTVNGATTYYNTDNGTILSQSDGDNTWYFQYDTNGSPLGFVLNGTQYFYITNQMGDILAITDTDGSIVGNYEYDAWGKVLIADTDIAKQNPLRYRGYYYDNETGYYYLQSRYYDSDICRFINADTFTISRIKNNNDSEYHMFVYCDSEPINNVDPTGFWDKIEVHNGYTNKNQSHYYYTKVDGKWYKYGTYYWAICCGFGKSRAKRLAKHCENLDNYFSSLSYAAALINISQSGAYYSRERLAQLKNWQYYHFNGNKKGEDSRVTFANTKMKKAVSLWKKGEKDKALEHLGYGLHALQDREAHGQQGRGNDIPVQTANADKIEYVWKDSQHVKLKKDTLHKTRLVSTAKATKDYINKFIRLIGGKSKVR